MSIFLFRYYFFWYRKNPAISHNLLCSGQKWGRAYSRDGDISSWRPLPIDECVCACANQVSHLRLWPCTHKYMNLPEDHSVGLCRNKIHWKMATLKGVLFFSLSIIVLTIISLKNQSNYIFCTSLIIVILSTYSTCYRNVMQVGYRPVYFKTSRMAYYACGWWGWGRCSKLVPV